MKIICSLFLFAISVIANANEVKNFKTKPLYQPAFNIPEKNDGRMNNPEISPYVAGGTMISPLHKYPFLVAIHIDKVHFCGGFVLSAEWVLTAAQCIYNADLAIIQFGAHNITTNETTQVIVESSDFITHENFSSRTFVNDIALIKLPAPIEFTNEISSAALPTPDDFDLGVGEYVNMMGWGEFSGGITDVPNEVRSAIISNEECAGIYGESITSASLCTSGEFERGTCSSDAGGPVVYVYDTGSGALQARGIISSPGACGDEYPSVHTRLTHYLDWIQTNSGIVP